MKTGGTRILARALFGFAAILFALAVCADDFSDELAVLWWQVGDFSYQDLGDIPVKRVNGDGFTTAADIGAEYARIREVTTGEYLYMLDPDTGVFSLESINVPMTWVADVTKFASNSPEAAFMIELGNYEGNTWSTLAVSGASSYTDLAANHNIVTASGYMPNPVNLWTPSFVVPEPNSGLLVLVGAALLALRRRRGVLRRG